MLGSYTQVFTVPVLFGYVNIHVERLRKEALDSKQSYLIYNNYNIIYRIIISRKNRILYIVGLFYTQFNHRTSLFSARKTFYF